MNSTIENAKRQILTKRSVVGFIKQLVPALVAALCCVSAFAIDEVPPDIVLTQDTTIENISGGYNGMVRQTIYINGYTLTLYNTEDSTYLGYIVSTGNIIKTGSKTLTLGNPTINYTGTITVSEGTLNLTENGTLSKLSAVINNGVIDMNVFQVLNNLSGAGIINISSGTDLDLKNTTDTTYSGQILGDGAISVGGPGKLTLSGANTYPGGAYVYSNGYLRLTGSALDYTGTLTVNVGTVDFDVEGSNTIKRIDVSSDNAISAYNGSKMIKSGDGTLQICCEASGLVSADSVFISSGRVDYQGYFESDASFGSPRAPKDCFVVEEGAVFSPGIGVGDVILNGGNFTIRDNAIALFEFGAYNEDSALQNYDTITINGEYCKTVLNSNSIIQLAFTNDDAWKWAKEGAEYHIITEGFTFNPNDGDFSYVLGNYQDYFKLVAREDQGFYLIGLGAPEPPPVVPEPSTWALLILGVAGLLYLKKLRKK
ncbi:MAG: autotransporter-associated beta strand repeat-containing protein [Thermoguttaceae bacterium]|nr:autotransporter-associated beta strand repeat-containing protein [Thermoguttaceae bacterium]